MMEDCFESFEDEDLETEAEEEVDKVLWELTAGIKAFIYMIYLHNYFI